MLQVVITRLTTTQGEQVSLHLYKATDTSFLSLHDTYFSVDSINLLSIKDIYKDKEVIFRILRTQRHIP